MPQRPTRHADHVKLPHTGPERPAHASLLQLAMKYTELAPLGLLGTHRATRVTPEEPQAAERVLRYLFRPPVANARTRTQDTSQVEILRTHPAPDGAPRVTLDPLEFLARATSHIPPPRQHQLRYYGLC